MEYKIGAAVYCGYFFLAAMSRIGQYPKKWEPIFWYEPLVLLGLLIIPFVLGYLAGREDEQRSR